MDHYIDVTLKPDAEMRENVLLNKIYTKLHKALFDLEANSIGVSFPRYKVKLGDVLRIHGTQADLERLQGTNWIGGMSGYSDISSISAVPDEVSYRRISRKQTNMSPAKLRRLIKRGTISAEQVKDYSAKMYSQSLDNPYLEMESSSNEHKHRRFIEFSEISDEAIAGTFDHFGLSKQATIPWF